VPRFLYLVTAHTRSKQVARLVDALLAASPAGEVLLHYDPTGPRFEPARQAASSRFHLYPSPRAVLWGDFSLVDAFLDVTRWAVERAPFDWLVWISGQDYPLGRLEAFEAQLAQSGADASFRHFSAAGHPGWPAREGIQRYECRHFALPRMPGFHRLPRTVRDSLDSLRRWCNETQGLMVMRPRRLGVPMRLGIRWPFTPFSASWPCIGGWSWLNLNVRCVSRIHEFVAARPDVVAYYRHTHCPDESFLHTVVVNTPGLRIDVNPFRHVSWGNRLFPTHPLCVTRGPLLDAAIASGMPFARKFDIEVDAACLDILDLRISAREPIGEAHA